MNLETIKQVLFSCVDEISKHAQYGYGMYSDLDSMVMIFDNSTQKITRTGEGKGIILNAWNGSRFEEYVTTILEQDNVVNKAIELGKRNTFIKGGIPIPHDQKIQKNFDFKGKINPRDVPLDEKVAMVRKLQTQTKNLHPSIVNSIVTYVERKEHTLFIDPSKVLHQTVFRFILRVEFIASSNGCTNSWVTGFNGTGGYENVVVPQQEIEDALENLFLLLKAESVIPGAYHVIADPETSGIIAHEAFGHGVENDVILKQRSRAKKYMGKKVGSPLVNMSDDPLYTGAYGFYSFDDEGQLARKTSIIKEGILLEGLSDYYSAIHLHVGDKGNGRRENFAHKPYSRMSNTFFEPGDTPLEQMIEELNDGLYIVNATNGMEDPKNWGIQCQAKMAREVKNGKFSGRNFAPIGITGYVPDLLNSITQVSDQFRMGFGGTCIKGYKERVPVSVGGPHIKMKARIS